MLEEQQEPCPVTRTAAAAVGPGGWSRWSGTSVTWCCYTRGPSTPVPLARPPRPRPLAPAASPATQRSSQTVRMPDKHPALPHVGQHGGGSPPQRRLLRSSSCRATACVHGCIHTGYANGGAPMVAAVWRGNHGRTMAAGARRHHEPLREASAAHERDGQVRAPAPERPSCFVMPDSLTLPRLSHSLPPPPAVLLCRISVCLGWHAAACSRLSPLASSDLQLLFEDLNENTVCRLSPVDRWLSPIARSPAFHPIPLPLPLHLALALTARRSSVICPRKVARRPAPTHRRCALRRGDRCRSCWRGWSMVATFSGMCTRPSASTATAMRQFKTSL